MRRKYFETISQSVLTKVVPKTVKSYEYLVIKLPATFLNQKVEVWSPKRKQGKFFVPTKDGGTALINVSDEDRTWIKKNDVMVATFKKDEKVKLK